MPAHKQTASLSQSQQLRLNQKQMMLGRLLEMSTAEFEEEIVRALEENPALAVIDSPAPEDAGDTDPADDFDSEDIFRQRRPRPEFYQPSASGSQADLIEEQLADLHLTSLERVIGNYIIGNLDSSGYLTRSAQAIADDLSLNEGIEAPVSLVEKMINTIKSLDPAGIGAQNLRECLLIQLRRLAPSPAVELAMKILDKHYKAFANNRLDLIKDALRINDKQLSQAMDAIRALNPKPGAGLFDNDADARTRHVTPDFIVDIDNHGRPWVSLAGDIPELTIEPSFDPDSVSDPTAAEFIRERADGAADFIDVVRRRSKTLMAIINAIIALQPQFFSSFDIADLKPMVIRDIEKATGLDKSTISRATSTKYILTPDGIFPLRALFSESASASADVSAREVEAVLREIVDAEDKSSPLNDDELTDALNKRGLPVARRTVAKYRERLGIPVARQRKQY